MSGQQIRLLALDGGGVRGLSSLMILQQLMAAVRPESPPKPCEFFDMIGGTSTGGLIAIMLGRLQMTVQECIEAYIRLSDRVFHRKNRMVTIKGRIRGKFDSAALEEAVRTILTDRGLSPDALLKDSDDAPCKVFVCATSKKTSQTVCLTSYRSPRSGTDLLDSTRIWEACRATSAATSFFDPIALGPFDEEFVDGALGANNPTYALWGQAQDVWGGRLKDRLGQLVSIGTGLSSVKPVPKERLGIRSAYQKFATFKRLAIETEKTAEQFRRDKSSLDDQGRYYRFNVDRGLQGIGLEDSKKIKEIAAVTRLYLESQAVFKQIQACANPLSGSNYFGPYQVPFSLQGIPISENYVKIPSVTAEIERRLLSRCLPRQARRRVFVLCGLGGIGKTQLAVEFVRQHHASFSAVFWLDGRSEDRLMRGLAACAERIPEGQIPMRRRRITLEGKAGLNILVEDVLAWLAQPDNIDWLLVLDNMDQYCQQISTTESNPIWNHLRGDHGSVLITTRMSPLMQLGDSKRLNTVDEDVAKAIFEKWYGQALPMDDAGKELHSLLGGLPLALAQAASYLRETRLDCASYVRLYKQRWDELMLAEAEFGSVLADYSQRSVATTWTASFRAIENESRNAANLLRLWAFLDRRDIWHGLLRTAAADAPEHCFPAWLLEIARNEVKFLNALRLLLRYSMIDGPESATRSYSIHPVVQRWTLHVQPFPERTEFLQLAMRIVAQAKLGVLREGDSMFQQRLLQHAESCSQWKNRICPIDCGVDGSVATGAICSSGRALAKQDLLKNLEVTHQRAPQGTAKVLGEPIRLFTKSTTF